MSEKIIPREYRKRTVVIEAARLTQSNGEAPHALFNSREAAEAYAEPLVKRSAQRSLMARVVDRDHEGGRVSGPCAGGNHHYCLGPHAILPCTCNCHEHTDPEQR